MNKRSYKVAKHIPHRLSEYVHHHCFCYKDSVSLGTVRGIGVKPGSYLKGTVLFFVSYLSDGVSRAQIYKDGEISLLEIVDDRVSLTEIAGNLTKMEAEIRRAEHWYSDGDTYLDFLKDMYFSYARDIPAILRVHGYRS